MDFEYRLNQLEARLNNIIRIGVVSSLNIEDCTVKVVFQEFDNSLVSYDLPVMVKQSLQNKDYYLPDVNEQVICIFLATGLESGFVLGSLYNEEDKPVVNNANKRSVTFSDGSYIEYDRENHELNISAKNINLTGDLNITGNIKATGNINGADIEASGSISDSKSSINKMRTIYNSHAHTNQGASPPSELM